jgi:hypothetical protein
MQTLLQTIFIGALSVMSWGQPDRAPPPTNCTKTFDHSFSLDELLNEFRDDDIRGNMSKAAPVLWSHPNLTIEYRYNALNHEDWQVRQVICNSIWKRAHRQRFDPELNQYIEIIDPDYPITETLIRVTIEGLRHDTTPYDHKRRRGLVLYNASDGITRLLPIAHDWIGLLEEAMESDDLQQRVIAAYILGRAGVAQSVKRASQILLPHLRDNQIWGDAKFCVFGLGGFGDELLPYLTSALSTIDKQQRDLITLLIMDIKDPPTSEQELQNRSKYNTITTSVYDPAFDRAPGALSWFYQLYKQ